MREDLRLPNLSTRPMTVPVSLRVGADFADVFAVKESRVRVVGEIAATPTGEALELVLHLGESLRGVRVESSDATARPDGLDFLAELLARGEWHTTVLVRPSVEGEEAGGLFHPGAEPGESGRRAACGPGARAPRASPTSRTRNCTGRCGAAWRTWARCASSTRGTPNTRRSPQVPPGHGFMALFGRDSLLSSYLALPRDPAHHGERSRQAVDGCGHRRPCAGAGRVGVAGLQGGRVVRRNTAAKGYDAWMRRNSSVPSPSAPD
ncbi:glycogen debranching N-terminal domain-containing protein [Streptomyces avermitilis]|uniref:glycogen debranching N-terminal domain-containing protein n=1 Tax=Streptomyces avermitilis TaxID=33903 RepID=UPI0033B2BD7C